MIGAFAGVILAMTATASERYWSRTVLTYGPRTELTGHRSVAIACGFRKAYLRPFRDRDIPTDRPNPRWVILDAGTIAAPGTKPYECFMDRVVRPGLRNARE